MATQTICVEGDPHRALSVALEVRLKRKRDAVSGLALPSGSSFLIDAASCRSEPQSLVARVPQIRFHTSVLQIFLLINSLNGVPVKHAHQSGWHSFNTDSDGQAEAFESRHCTAPPIPSRHIPVRCCITRPPSPNRFVSYSISQ